MYALDTVFALMNYWVSYFCKDTRSLKLVIMNTDYVCFSDSKIVHRVELGRRVDDSIIINSNDWKQETIETSFPTTSQVCVKLSINVLDYDTLADQLVQ